MLKKLICLVGLPGSGKTTWINNNLSPDDCYIDDITDFQELVDKAQSYSLITLSDPHLCRDDTRILASKMIYSVFPDLVIDWIYWENDVDKAWSNVLKRNDGRKISISFLRSLSSEYTPVSPLPIIN